MDPSAHGCIIYGSQVDPLVDQKSRFKADVAPEVVWSVIEASLAYGKVPEFLDQMLASEIQGAA